MQLTFDSDVEEFRAEFSAFLDEHLPPQTQTTERPRSVSHMPQWARDWQRLLFDNGWLLPAQPPEFGGRNATVLQQFVHLDELCRRRIYHSFNPQGVNIIAASLLSFGSDEQKHRWAVPVLKAELTASLGMSEPSAGSDLASLRTRAVLDGDHFVVNGQKVWTSGAHDADFLLAFVRTDPDAPKHKGITALAIPMDAPGVTVRDLVLTTGSRDFNEVFFDEVTVPVENRIGPENGGWNLAMTTLGFERGPADVGYTSRYRRTLSQLEDVARNREIGSAAREAVASAYVATEVLRLHVLRSLSARAAAGGGTPGPEGSIDKLLTIRTEQRLHHAEMDVLGSDPLVGEAPQALFAYLKSRAVSIAGGTSQIQQNIVATRVMDLPST
jgi:alkylation response protein AidB-like acyl-CoA dehydrogenase